MTEPVQVHLAQMVSKEELFEHPRNSNKQSKMTFSELRKSIRENGFDETLTIVPRDEGVGYYIVSGNHRFRAGVAEGMDEFPCVIRNDWTGLQEQVELVRRNYVRGDIDRDAFTAAVDALSMEQGLNADEVRQLMGFEDIDTFLKFYKQEQEREEEKIREVTESEKTTAGAVKMIDDLGLVLSAIFEKHGDTVPYSYIIFPAGGKNHLFVAATPAVISTMQEIAEYSVSNHMDINLVLGGVLALGVHHSALRSGEPKRDEIKKAGSQKDGPTEF